MSDTLVICARCGHETTEPLVAADHRCTVVVEQVYNGCRIRATRSRLTGMWHAAIWDDAASGYTPCAARADDAEGALAVARAELDLWATT